VYQLNFLKKINKRKKKLSGAQRNNSKLYTAVINSQYIGEAARILLLSMNYCEHIASFAKAVCKRQRA
jgi:hypothetical protein